MMKVKVLLAIVIFSVCLAAQTRVSQNGYMTGNAIIHTYIQPPTLRNSTATGGAASAVTASIAAVAGQSVYLYAVTGYCSGGTAGVVTVKDGVAGTAMWTTSAALSNSLTFFTPIASTSGNGMDIVLGSCGGSYTGTLNVQASQF